MAKNAKIWQEIGLYRIALKHAEKAKADIGHTIDRIYVSEFSTTESRSRAAHGLARAADALRDAIAGLEHSIRQAEDLDAQIEEERASHHFEDKKGFYDGDVAICDRLGCGLTRDQHSSYSLPQRIFDAVIANNPNMR